jgi:predicted nucleic acid-binding protein
MIVVADTSPINYLVLIRCEHLLPSLFGNVVIPRAVLRELTHAASRSRVRAWASELPVWVDVRTAAVSDPALEWLGPGEREGLALAQEIGADLILIDDLQARQEARKRNLRVTGTLGILREAARRDLIDLTEAMTSLQATGFYAPLGLIAELLQEDARRKQNG